MNNKAPNITSGNFWLHMFFIFFLLIKSSVSAQERISASQLISDLSLFRLALEEVHPGLYRYTSKPEFDTIFTNVAQKIKGDMSRQEFYRLLLPVVSQIKCGHTKFHPDENWSTNFFFNTGKVFPWKLHFEEHRAFYIDDFTHSSKIPAGAEIVSINGKPVTEIITEMLPAFFSDGNNLTFKYREMDRYFSAWYANLFEGPDTFTVVYKQNAMRTEIKLPAVSYTAIEEYEKKQEEILAKPPFSLDFKSSETAVLTISSFYMEPDSIKFKKFLKNAFHLINEKKIKHLIIDLRDNEGGKDKRGALLLSYLMNQKFRYYDHLELTTNKKFTFAGNAHLPWYYNIFRLLVVKKEDGRYLWKNHKNLKEQKPQKNNYSGEVYVLINGASFSVTAEFAAVTHYLKRAIFIGEETGGGYYGNNSGTFAIVTLPNSRLNIGIPLVAYYLKADDYPYPDRGIIPDFMIKPSVFDILSGKDVVMDFTITQIKSQVTGLPHSHF